jgi:SAM-dependent methyltransferase
VRRSLRRIARREDPLAAPPVGKVHFGSLRRVTPISTAFGYDRGNPIDRHYIESFLAANASDIRGRVLEIGDDSYTRRFGADRVERSDVLHVHGGNPRATIVGDIADAPNLPDAAFDCIILTQTLHLVYDVHAAVGTLHRALRPGGVALVTVPTITQQSEDEWAGSWYWAFTARAMRRMFGDVFGTENVDVEAHGNVLTAIAFLHGLATEELRPAELDHRDPQYEMLVTVRAVRGDERGEVRA